MIAELLRPTKIVLGLKGEFTQVLERLLSASSLPELKSEFLAAVADANRYSYIGNHIALPHVRSDKLTTPEMLLGISSEGVSLNGDTVHVILFFASPADRTEQHLQLLQRLTALLPEIKDELLAQRDPSLVLRVIARGEQRAGKTTYINLSQEQVAFELQTDLERGITQAEARRRLQHYGPNSLTRSRRAPWYLKLLKNFFSFFAALLWIAAFLCFAPGVDMPQLGSAILAVIALNGLFAFLQEQKTDRAVEVLQELISQKCRVIRGGVSQEIDAAELVPGDVILLEQGDLVPADARLIEAFQVEVDNSSLTGESHPARRYKSDRAILIPGKFLWIELPNIVFAGTALVQGSARAVVIGTGMHSEIGKIAGLTQAIPIEDSPLQKQLRSTVLAIASLAGALGLAFLLLGWLVAGLSFVEAFVFFIGLFVANVPEGLLPTVTLSLAMAVTRMAKRHALVKSLPSVETLGCTTVICCDKTGTLTQNLMMVKQVYVDDRLIGVSGAGYEPRGEFLLDGRPLSLEEISRWTALKRALECSFICNNARLERTASGYRVLGDPTEGALVCLAEKGGVRGIHQRLHVNGFDSVRKRMSVVVELGGENNRTVYVKGAPLETLQCCDRILAGGQVSALDENRMQKIMATNDALAERGLRVLALAYSDDPELREQTAYSIEQVEKKLVFLGLAAISDPVRPEVPPAIRACHTAGIRVIMITGDYALTAASIGREIGLGGNRPPRVYTGAEISEMSDSELRDALAEGETIFARAAPEHKLRIVSALKQIGEIVAVTGDGVNDAPALKKADIGIAMGLRGNDVAKEAAHIILTDDNFHSIIAAIEEGRAVFDNIKRFTAYILNSNPQEMYPYILWILFPGLPLAMTIMGVLAVDVGTDLIPAMGLGIEPPEKDIMERPPRRRDEKLLSLSFILRAYFVQGSLLAFSCYATYYYAGWMLGYWDPTLGPTAMPASPKGLKLEEAPKPYLQTLTAYFFPTVTTQIANVHCKRSWKSSLFAEDFLNPRYRSDALNQIARWRPRPYAIKVKIEYRIGAVAHAETPKAFLALIAALLSLPLKFVLMMLSKIALALERPLIAPLAAWLARFFARHYVLFNFVSNPLIDGGILFELVLSYLFFYSPLANLYYFAPVPWHVYLFAFHGTLLLFAFEEAKKYYRRKGHKLEFLG
ncbi:MAG TPA: HAD-IC family P-type ATPase [Candidatus Acidoferrales bacterium]|nr:HAD-IC family P-type ATPase [Candidatus Acidoferrales bacterium]